jgi:branched-chain amino acid aminotransferase
MRSKNDMFKYQGGGDKPGPAVVKLLEQLKGIQSGKVKDSFGWCEPVREYKPGEYGVEVEDVKMNGHVPGQLP